MVDYPPDIIIYLSISKMKVFDQLRSEKKLKTLQYEKEDVDFAKIINPEEIECLEITFCNLTSLSGIACLSNLRRISLYYCRFLQDISAIEDLQMLEGIELYSLPKVKVHFSISKLANLKGLSYTRVGGIETISGIEKLSKLMFLGLSQVKVIDEDYSPIVQSKSLERVFWCGSPFKVPALKELRKLRPDIVIGGNLYNEIYLAKKSKSNDNK